MDSPHRHYRVRYFEKVPGLPPIHQSHRYRSEKQALAFIAKLRTEQPGVRFVLECREARIGPWTQVDVRGAR